MILKILTNFIKGFLFLALGFIIAMPLSMLALYLASIFGYCIVILFLIIIGSCVIGFLNK